MAVLPDDDRRKIWAHLMRVGAQIFALAGFIKPELRQLVDATDDWLESNATAYNNSIPIAIRSKFSAAHKLVAIAYVALRRSGLLKTAED
jgi:hypothetical protein